MTLCPACGDPYWQSSLRCLQGISSQHRPSGENRPCKIKPAAHNTQFLLVFARPSMPPTGKKQEQESRSKDAGKRGAETRQLSSTKHQCPRTFQSLDPLDKQGKAEQSEVVLTQPPAAVDVCVSLNKHLEQVNGLWAPHRCPGANFLPLRNGA